MPALLNHPPNAKGKRSRPILFALIALSAVSFAVHVPARVDKEELIAKMHARMLYQDFERLYDESDDTVHRNVTKEQFVRRMNVAAAKLKEIDGGLNFKRDAVMEHIISDFDLGMFGAAQTLERDGKSVSILIFWDEKGRFFDMRVLPKPGTPEGYTVPGVSYNQLRAGAQSVDY